MSKANGGKVKSCSKIKDGNRKLILEEVGARRIWKELSRDFYNIRGCSPHIGL